MWGIEGVFDSVNLAGLERFHVDLVEFDRPVLYEIGSSILVKLQEPQKVFVDIELSTYRLYLTQIGLKLVFYKKGFSFSFLNPGHPNTLVGLVCLTDVVEDAVYNFDLNQVVQHHQDEAITAELLHVNYLA